MAKSKTTDQQIDLNPGIANVRAIVTTRWGGHAYRPRVIDTIESYTVDSAMDTDADTWSVEITDPWGTYVDTLDRDSEVRVQLFGVGQNPDYIMTGLADEVEFSDEGILTLTGRDLSSIAMDSTVPPKQFRHVRPWSIVAQQASELGFNRTRLAKGNMVKKVVHTDGSESYWEFWYRLYRTEKMWIWTEPNGMLRADFLNYGGGPNYWLGVPKASDSPRIKEAHIPVEQITVRKSTQSRVAEVWVFAHRGSNGFHEIAIDPTLKGWQKRPRRILLDATARTSKRAMKVGWQEIFEGKVGEIEYTVTIPDPGFLIRQNTIARLRIPELNLFGEFFVVGVQSQVGMNGAMQQVRLRDRKMALTNRIPAEPKATGVNAPHSALTETQLGTELSTQLPHDWGNYFVNAANQFHGPWDYNLFLAVLLAICDQETNFMNIRERGGPGADGIEWYDPPDTQPQMPTGRAVATEISQGSGNPFTPPRQDQSKTSSLLHWKIQFCNEVGDGLWPKSEDAAVGPMQLQTRDLKHQADDYTSGGTQSLGAATTITAAKLDSYLKQHNSPLSGYGNTMVSEGQKNNVDPRMICAIAGAETTFATDPNSFPAASTGHNAWGLGPGNMYSDWPTGIAACASNLGGSPYIADGNISVSAIQAHWAPGGAANDPTGLNNNWTRNVSQFLTQTGGNTQDVTYHSSPEGQKATAPKTNAAGHDEYTGNRWMPEANIWIAASYLRNCLTQLQQDSGNDDDIWMGVMAYHRSVDGAHKFWINNHSLDSYTKAVKAKVMTDPGYLGEVKTARQQSVSDAQQAGPVQGNIFSTPPSQYPDNLFDSKSQPADGKVNSEAAIESLTHIKRGIDHWGNLVDLKDVDWRLLTGINNLGAYLGKTILVTSGYRTYAQQKDIWDRYGHNPLLAADPAKGSNHMRGQACDCTIDGVEMGHAVPASTIEKFGIWCSMWEEYHSDPVHVTRIGVHG